MAEYGGGYVGDPRGREAVVEARQGRDDAKWEAMSIQGRINNLERQKAKARGGGLLPGDDYSLTGNISKLGRLYSDKLTNQYQGKYGEEYFDKYGGWGSFNDLMAHGYLGSRVGLPMTQTWEAATQSQPSDFVNNALAARFFRGGQGTYSKGLMGIPGLIAGQFKQVTPNAVRINNIMSKAGIQPASASARWSHPMDAWGRLVHAEMSNPGSTGWNFQMNTEDKGVHAGGYLWDVLRGKTGAKLW
jgi:hypothetical protein